MSQFKRYLNIINEMKVSEKKQTIFLDKKEVEELSKLLNDNFKASDLKRKNENEEFKKFIENNFHGGYPLKLKNNLKFESIESFKTALIDNGIVRERDTETINYLKSKK